jgi:hypothetical protein
MMLSQKSRIQSRPSSLEIEGISQMTKAVLRPAVFMIVDALLVENRIAVGVGYEQGVTSAPGKLEPYQIVGVVKDSKYRRVDEETLRTAYVASGQDPDPWPTIHYEERSGVPVEVLMHSMRAAIADVNSAVSLEFRTLEAQVDVSVNAIPSRCFTFICFRIAGAAFSGDRTVRDHIL